MEKSMPNIILISIDTLRNDLLTIPGQEPKNIVPVLDRFASENICFERSYCAGGFSVPANASVFSGMYPVEHGVNSFFKRLPFSMTEFLRKSGYNCSAIVTYKIFNILLKGYFNDITTISQISKSRHGWPERLVEEFGKWVEQKQFMPEPFFHFLHFDGPHYPYRLPEKYFNPLEELYEKMDPVLRENFVLKEGEDTDSKKQMLNKLTLKINNPVTGMKLAKNDIEALRAFYNAQAANNDECLGEVFDILKRSGLYDDSVVIIYSDHGECLLEHGKIGHGNHCSYEELIRTVLAFKLPGYNRPLVVRKPVSQVQIFPTLLDYLDITHEEYPSYSSLLGHIRKGEETFLPQVFCEEIKKITVIEEDRKYMRFKTGKFLRQVKYESNSRRKAELLAEVAYRIVTGKPTREIYDLLNDPDERKNLYPGNRAAAAHYDEIIASYFARGDRMREDSDEYRLICSRWGKGYPGSEPHNAGMNGDAGAAAEPDLDEDVRRELEMLGYVPKK